MSLDSKVQALQKANPYLSFHQPSKILGEGSFASCVLAHHRKDNISKHVAVKISKGGQKPRKMLSREGRILQLLDHENVVKFISAGTGKDGNSNDFHFVVLEFASDGSLQTWFDRGERPLSRIDIMHEIFIGLEYLHNLSIYHRDIKPENLLVHTEENGECAIKLADFGLAEIEESSKHENGSPIYLPPEMWARNPPYDNAAADVYSASLILLQMLSPEYKLPWTDKPTHLAWFGRKGFEKLGAKSTILTFFKSTLVAAEERCTASELVAQLEDIIGNRQS